MQSPRTRSPRPAFRQICGGNHCAQWDPKMTPKRGPKETPKGTQKCCKNSEKFTAGSVDTIQFFGRKSGAPAVIALRKSPGRLYFFVAPAANFFLRNLQKKSHKLAPKMAHKMHPKEHTYKHPERAALLAAAERRRRMKPPRSGCTPWGHAPRELGKVICP